MVIEDCVPSKKETAENASKHHHIKCYAMWRFLRVTYRLFKILAILLHLLEFDRKQRPHRPPKNLNRRSNKVAGIEQFDPITRKFQTFVRKKRVDEKKACNEVESNRQSIKLRVCKNQAMSPKRNAAKRNAEPSLFGAQKAHVHCCIPYERVELRKAH